MQLALGLRQDVLRGPKSEHEVCRVATASQRPVVVRREYLLQTVVDPTQQFNITSAGTFEHHSAKVCLSRAIPASGHILDYYFGGPMRMILPDCVSCSPEHPGSGCLLVTLGVRKMVR